MSRSFWIDLRRTIHLSLWRYFSIAALMLVGVFIMVGLTTTSPDMRATAQKFYDETNLADVTVTSPFGLNQTDRALIASAPDTRTVEFAHSEDVIFAGKNTSVHLMSLPDASSADSGRFTAASNSLSHPKIIQGELPISPSQIALDAHFSGDYSIGDTVSFEKPLNEIEKTLASKNLAEVAVGDYLNLHTFTVTGFVQSAEYLSKDLLPLVSLGTGKLSGIGYVLPTVFSTDLAQVARVSVTGTTGMKAYDLKYLDKIHQHKEILHTLLKQRASQRLEEIKKQPQEDIKTKRDKISDSQKKIDDARDHLSQERARLEQIPLNADPHYLLETAIANQEKALDVNQADLNKKKHDLDKAQSDLDTLEAPQYTVTDRHDDSSYMNYGTFADRMDIMAAVFSIFSFTIALLVSLSTMTRMVQEERTSAGIYSALGYSPITVTLRYVMYGCSASFVGSLGGIVLGHLILPPTVFRAYAQRFIFPTLQQSFHPWLSLFATLIALVSTVLVVLIAIRREFTAVPATLLRPQSPKPGKRNPLERINFLWKKMSFMSKVTVRNLFRYKGRGIMTILGIAGCVGLMIAGIGLNNSISGVVHRQYSEITKYDLVALEDENAHQKNKEEQEEKSEESSGSTALSKQINQLPHVTNSLEVHFEKLSHEGKAYRDTQSMNLIVPAIGETNFKDFADLTDVSTGQHLSPENSGSSDAPGAFISQKLANLLGLKTGDTLTFTDSDEIEHKVQINAVVTMLVEHYVFMNESSYASIFGKSATQNAHLVALESDSTSEKLTSQASLDDASAALMKTDGIVSVIPFSSIALTVNSFIGGVNAVVGIMIAMGIILTIIITFNLTNINVSERVRELSTIKVLGFYPFEVTRYVYRETLILTILGIFFGWWLGAELHNIMIDVLPPDFVMLNPDLYTSNIVISASITLVVSVIVMWIFHIKLQRINMLDALKSIE